MKKILTMTFIMLVALLVSTALADRGYNRNDSGYYASQGARIERHLDRQGDRVQHRFEQKADRAEWQGKYAKAEHMRAKGERINRHLDRKGKRIHVRFDRRHEQMYRGPYGIHRNDHRRQRVIYRSYDPHGSYFGVVINQPGLYLGWGWHD